MTQNPDRGYLSVTGTQRARSCWGERETPAPREESLTGITEEREDDMAAAVVLAHQAAANGGSLTAPLKKANEQQELRRILVLMLSRSGLSSRRWQPSKCDSMTSWRSFCHTFAQ